MIRFNEDLKNKALKIVKEAHDLADVKNDLDTIENLYNNAKTKADIETAKLFDARLRRKYPIINEMLQIANSFPKVYINGSAQTQPLDELYFLKQDYYGVLCDTLLKKCITTTIEEFIEKVY